jgi:hypothetical protein
LGKLLHFVSLVDILPIFYTKKRYRGRLSIFRILPKYFMERNDLKLFVHQVFFVTIYLSSFCIPR